MQTNYPVYQPHHAEYKNEKEDHKFNSREVNNAGGI